RVALKTRSMSTSGNCRRLGIRLHPPRRRRNRRRKCRRCARRNPFERTTVIPRMNDAQEIQRHDSPGGRPQPLCYHNGTLWVGAWDTDRLYAIDPRSWTISKEFDAPGRPYGIAAIGDELR